MSDPTFDDIARALDDYHVAYRSPSLAKLEVSPLYDLFPKSGAADPRVARRWPDDPYPSHGSPGVYFVLADDLELLYIGKASQFNTMSNRLASYFGYERPGSDCRVIHPNWIRPPRYVATLAVERAFEAPSLEEFLIFTLRPRDNTLGKPR